MAMLRCVVVLGIFLIQCSLSHGNSPLNSHANKDLDDVQIRPAYLIPRQPNANDLPYQVALIEEAPRKQSLCGGSLIHENWVLSAAHCFPGFYHPVMARIGGVNLEIVAYKKYVDLKLEHPYYKEGSPDYDIALFRLPEAARGPEIGTIGLSETHGRNLSFSTLQIAGFGSRWTGGAKMSDRLVQINVQLVSNYECQLHYSQKKITESMFCVKSWDHFDPKECYGDTGGPLTMVDHLNRVVQLGIASFSKKGCQLHLPMVYTKTSVYANWISSTIKKNAQYLYG